MKTISMLAAAAVTLSASLTYAPATADAAPTTQVTIRIASCDGCEVGVASYLQGSMDVWSAKPRRVEDGAVSFRVPTDRTAGLSITVRAPWEGATGYVTNVALRYKGHQPGDKVGLTAARAATRASGCWAGTTEDASTIKVVARKVRVDGLGGKVPGTIAYAKVTQDWLRPLVPARHGVVGTQDVMPCKAA
jgi:hypothetical protein